MMSLFGDRRAPSERLARQAARWRTERQLRLLAHLPTAGGERASFAVLGDVEPSRFWIYRKLFNEEGVFVRQLEAIQGHRVNFVVQLGDMVSKGEHRRYEAFYRELKGAWRGGRPYLTVIGNHDRSRPNGKSHSSMYRSLFGRSNYFFDHARTRFVVLDSSAKRVTPAQLRWLDMVLTTPLRKVVFTHMPPVHLGLWGGVGRLHALGGFVGGAREFSRVVSANGVSRVYMGHVHAFGVQDHEGVRYVLTGGGGSALFPSGTADRFHHFLTVDVGPDGLRERVHALDGRVFEIPSAPILLPTHEHPHPWRDLARRYGRRLARALGA
ncbi:MAG: metallophosphoesterase [Elusimicrobia bacterium]|nr:metallophosphoesterase [Elusimicrobiota bacterium]